MLRFDLTKEQKIPAKLVQQYLFLPAQVYIIVMELYAYK